MELSQYLGLFIDESKENLQKLNESLLKLETQPDDLEILNDIFRVAHTLKGMSKTMGFNNIADLTHNMENVLEPLRNGNIKATGIIIDVLFRCLDGLEELVDKVISGNYEDKSSAVTDLVNDLQDIMNASDEADSTKQSSKEMIFNEYELAVINDAKANGYKSKEITVFLINDCVLPGVRAYMVTKALDSYGEIIKTHPIAEEIENGKFDKTFKLFLLTLESDYQKIEETIKQISEIEDVKIVDLDLTKTQDKDQNEIKKESLKEKNGSSGDSSNQQSISKVIPQTIRVSANKMDKLMNLVGELVISRTQMTQISNELKVNELNTAIGAMGNITSNIQEIVMKLRMVPIEQVFNRFPRLVRDISKDLNKEVNLKIIGKDTEIDRVVIDEIGDPLVHLIRNSLDHGLESTEERILAGKPAKGTLELLAFNEGDSILIKVCDDGKGIDPQKIKASAIKKGVITPDIAQALSDKEALDLIFAPGLSTVEVATDISGRGVGMDVVKSKVASLGGNVMIASEIGKGTSITINLPSTMAIIQALLIKVSQEIYAIPLNYISEVIDIKPQQVRNIQNKEVIVLREKTLPLIRLHKLLGVPNFENDLSSESFTVVIVRSQGRYIGIVVSDLVGQQEVVIKPINKKLCAEDYISGATTLGNGRVALIINVNALL
ncbi:MAG: chemotaxis protein CheA [bacterium]